MTERKGTSIRYSSGSYRELVRQNMELGEFREQAQQFIETLSVVEHQLFTAKASLRSPLHLRMMSTRLLKCINELGDLCKLFHNCIEFSPHLPLSVIPFLLPLIVSLKKVTTQVLCLKHYLAKDHLQIEDYHAIRDNVGKLNDVCHEIETSIRFLLDQARFREKSA